MYSIAISSFVAGGYALAGVLHTSGPIAMVVAGLFIGNTAETVLRHVECSVLTVKPAGFETPVTL